VECNRGGLERGSKFTNDFWKMTNVTHNYFLCIYLYFELSTCFEHTVLIIRGRQIVSIQPLVAVGGRVVCRSVVNFRLAHDMATDTE